MKGFTLVELLAAIVVLGLLATIVFFSVKPIIDESKTQSYNVQVESVISSAKLWVLENDTIVYDNLKNLEYGVGKYFLSIDILKSSGYLKKETNIDGCIIITCTLDCKQYNYEFGECNS